MTSTAVLIKSTLRAVQVWRLIISVLVFCVPQLAIFIFVKSCMFPELARICYLFIILHVTIMCFLNFIQTNFSSRNRE